jgi:hypothetical protein
MIFPPRKITYEKGTLYQLPPISKVTTSLLASSHDTGRSNGRDLYKSGSHGFGLPCVCSVDRKSCLCDGRESEES